MTSRLLLVATSNAHKTAEIAAMIGAAWQVVDLRAYPALISPEEDGDTFEANARIKAEAASLVLPDLLVLSDDSGLEVDALGKAPGVRSARYAGPQATDKDNRERVKLENKQKKPTIPPELLQNANSYEDQLMVVRMIVDQEQSRVASVIRNMIQVK
jgi:non-canonical purine NTP pyrophosphatase (RdgB/HAM1 family)